MFPWFIIEHQGQIHADLAGRFTLFWRPEERLLSIATAERLPFAVVNVPGGGMLGFRLLADHGLFPQDFSMNYTPKHYENLERIRYPTFVQHQ
jgi:hypothetical protein